MRWVWRIPLQGSFRAKTTFAPGDVPKPSGRPPRKTPTCRPFEERSARNDVSRLPAPRTGYPLLVQFPEFVGRTLAVLPSLVYDGISQELDRLEVRQGEPIDPGDALT